MKPILLSLMALTVSTTVAAQTCEPTPETHAVRILGVTPQGDLTDQIHPEVAGEASFYQVMHNGWVFALIKAETGWAIRVYDGEPVANAVDLTGLTPPLSAPLNPRQIYGWHFRNAANTGPNQGDVNAPQHLRAFVISPSLAGTGGIRPSTPGAIPATDPMDGIGWLRILDMGLADLEQGGTARMNYLKFDACVTWRRTHEEAAALEYAASETYLPEEEERFARCGLDLGSTPLQASILPRSLSGDLDGDGALDEVAQLIRRADGNRGLALCLAGTELIEIDLEDESAGSALRTGFIDQMEAWHWITAGQALPSHLQGLSLPDAAGDILILERIEKEAIVLYWQDGDLRTHALYRYVEP